VGGEVARKRGALRGSCNPPVRLISNLVPSFLHVRDRTTPLFTKTMPRPAAHTLVSSSWPRLHPPPSPPSLPPFRPSFCERQGQSLSKLHGGRTIGKRLIPCLGLGGYCWKSAFWCSQKEGGKGRKEGGEGGCEEGECVLLLPFLQPSLLGARGDVPPASISTPSDDPITGASLHRT
jgi:hypothetical protein